jgi:hypothetical protein
MSKRKEVITEEAQSRNWWGEWDIKRTIQTTQLEKTKEPKPSSINSSEQVREITSTRTEKIVRR